MREWTNQDLIEYVSRFQDQQREYVLKQLLESDLLEKFLGTTEGRLMLNSVVDSIAAETGNIVRLATDGVADNAEKMAHAALKINVAYNFMFNLAKMSEYGQTHVTKMKKAPKAH
jgi:fatty acid/phospholipid biosynthesis enzyme